jgi:hypothetical protein
MSPVRTWAAIALKAGDDIRVVRAASQVSIRSLLSLGSLAAVLAEPGFVVHLVPDGSFCRFRTDLTGENFPRKPQKLIKFSIWHHRRGWREWLGVVIKCPVFHCDDPQGPLDLPLHGYGFDLAEGRG